MKNLTYTLLLVLAIARPVSAQNDTALVLTFETFMELAKTSHPIAQQANLQLEKGEATLRQARGAFDPKAFSEVAQKYFDGDQYYSLTNSGLKIPTWFGIELKSGYEQNQGIYLDPENKNPSAGLWYAGVSVPLGQGLFIDQRRADLRKAQIYQNITAAEQQLMLNNLLYQAGGTYWEWFRAYHNLLVYESARDLATQRFLAVKQTAALGARPYIDTLEAGIQVQNRTFLLQQAQLDFANASAALSVFLWADGNIPLELAEGARPPSMDNLQAVPAVAEYVLLLDSFVQNHPEMQRSQYKIDRLEVDKRLKQEQLKPSLNLNYNPLTEPVNGDPLANYSINNYKWGVTFSMPMFLRKGRGSVQLADLKVQESELDLAMKQASLVYKANASLNEWETTRVQYQLYQQTVKDYGSLLGGEQRMFDLGESSLFLVNSREKGYINAQIKLIELLAKNQKAILQTGYVFGILSK